MSRLDPNGADFKGPKRVMNLGPTADEIRNKEIEEAPPMPEGPIKTAASYGERARARAAATKSIKKGGKPLGGAPPIPPEKYQQIANSLAPKPNFDDEDEAPAIPRAPIEPPESVKGVGSAYHVNREMAKGNIDRPVSMREAKEMTVEAQKAQGARKPLSPESVKAIEEMNAVVEKGEVEAEEQKAPEDIEEDLERAEKDMVGDSDVDLDFVGLAEARNTLLNPKRRKSIEARLDDMDIADLITDREIQQVVTVVPGKLTYTFRTYNQHEHLYCLQYVFESRGSQAYSEELLNTAKLVCSLIAINGAPLPEHREDIGSSKESVKKEKFDKKYLHVASFPTQIMADMSVQAMWFQDRVSKLFSLDELKNG
jgi:hypothetical protein